MGHNAGRRLPAPRLLFQIVYECLPDRVHPPANYECLTDRAHEPHHHTINLLGAIRESDAGTRPNHIADDSR